MINAIVHITASKPLAPARRWLLSTNSVGLTSHTFTISRFWNPDEVRGDWLFSGGKINNVHWHSWKWSYSVSYTCTHVSSTTVRSSSTRECDPARLCCCIDVALSSDDQYAPIHKKDWRMQRITTAHPEPFTHKHTLTPACAFLSHVFLTIDADASRRGHVGASHLALNPKARLCAKNSTATIGIINIASPIPLHTSRPLQRYKICVEKHKAPLILER